MQHRSASRPRISQKEAAYICAHLTLQQEIMQIYLKKYKYLRKHTFCLADDRKRVTTYDDVLNLINNNNNIRLHNGIIKKP